MADAETGPSVGSGMRGEGYYDAHSEFQRRVLESGVPAIRSAVAEMELPDQVVVADYGSGTGATSVHAMTTALDALRERDADLPVTLIHSDLFSNDFSGLFGVVAGPDGYLDRDRVYALAAGGSFFDQLLPAGTVHLGMCSNASHWFREQPDVEPTAGMYSADVSDEVGAQLAAQAAADWEAFMTARAAELAPGGRMLVQGIARDAEGRVSAARLLSVMWDVAVAMADDGLLDRDAVDRYQFPVYCRSAEEVAGGPLELVRADIEELANPYWEILQESGDVAAYTEHYTGFVRAFSESTLRENLFAAGSDPAALCDEFFERFAAATAADPEAGRYDAWILRSLFKAP